MSIKGSNPTQLVLDFKPGLCERFRSVRDCVAQGVYQRGLKTVASDLDVAPGNLSVQLSDDTVRHFSTDSLERYIEVTGDRKPIYYLCERFLGDKCGTSSKDELVDRLLRLQEEQANIIQLMKESALE